MEQYAIRHSSILSPSGRKLYPLPMQTIRSRPLPEGDFPLKRVKSIRANFREGPVLRLLIDDPYGAFVNVEFRNNSLRYGMLSVLPMIQHSMS